MVARLTRRLAPPSHQAAADRAAAAFAAIVDAVIELRQLEAPADWLAPCIVDGASDVRATLEARADEDGEAIDWRALEAILERLQDRRAGNVVQLKLL